MASRILTLQRQLRELGRIRCGWSEPYTKDGRELRRAVRSKTLVLTSAQEENIRAAAELWGGEVGRWKPQGAGPEVWRVVTATDAIEAILPPGEPLSQYYEMWTGGGCALRCDGETDQKSQKPCVCRAKYGEQWFERRPTEVCRPTSRLNVFLDLMDFGYWRVESHSFYAAQELAGTVDLVKGLIGPTPAVPINLRIDQRVKVEGGKTTPYPVIVVELRGQVARQILAGVAPVLAVPGREVAAIGAATPPAIEAPQTRAENRNQAPISAGQTRSPAPAARPTSPARPPATGGDTGSLEKSIAQATTVKAMQVLWADVAKTGDNALKQAWWARKRAIEAGDTASAVEPVAEPEPAVDEGEVEPNREEMWASALRLAGELGWDTATTSQVFRNEMGRDVTAADGWTLAQFADGLKAGLIK